MSERQIPDFEEFKEWVYARSVEEGDCWVWQRSTSAGLPQTKYQGRYLNVRRYLLAAKRGLNMDGKWVVGCSCKNEDCVNPAHLIQTTRSNLLRGRKQTTTHKAALSKYRRSVAKLTPEAVMDIRFGDGSTREKAARHGISREWARLIVNGNYWRDYSSPFAGLMA